MQKRHGLIVLPVLILCAASVSAQAQDTTVYSPGNGVSLPQLVKEVKAGYTPEARSAGIQGWVQVDAVVRADGTVGDVKVLGSCLGRVGAQRQPNGDVLRCTSLDQNVNAAKGDSSLGLNQQAMNAVKQWVFKPGLKDEKPVAVRITVEMTFDLRRKP